ncbi:MAG: hypothetical protein IPK69_03040 [Phycisphaerales bacterium]|nr:MAG: hypothetical protein IPK69_03040 [Phycisphaerales bacterium]
MPRLTTLAALLLACTGLALAACTSSPSSSPSPPAPGVVATTPTSDASSSTDPTEGTWTFEDGTTGRLIATPSYRIFTTMDHGPTTDRVPRFLEQALEWYTTALGELPRPSRRMDTFLMETRSQWERLTRRSMGDDAEIYLRIQRGGFAAGGRAMYFYIGQRDTLVIAAHEGWHQYTQSTFRSPLPIWLEEGIATYMEGFRWGRRGDSLPRFSPWSNPERFDTLRAAARAGRLMSLEQLLHTAPQDLMTGGGGGAGGEGGPTARSTTTPRSGPSSTSSTRPRMGRTRSRSRTWSAMPPTAHS